MKGFTLAELLIVVAIISVLVAISIPIFTAQLERAREAVDLANVRSAYSELIINFVIDGKDGVIVVALKQRQDDWQTPLDRLDIAGITPQSQNWIGVPRAGGNCRLEYILSTDKITINWNGGGNPAYINAVTPYQSHTLMDLKNMSNDERVAADQATLRALGEAILNQNLTRNQFINNFSILNGGNTFRIADYYQDKTGAFETTYDSDGFRLNSTSNLRNVLTDIGYNGGQTIIDSSGIATYQNSLFYSDELATNQFHNYPIDQTKRSILIDNITIDSSGHITGFNIYTKAMDNEANMNNEEKAKFNIRITK